MKAIIPLLPTWAKNPVRVSVDARIVNGTMGEFIVHRAACLDEGFEQYSRIGKWTVTHKRTGRSVVYCSGPNIARTIARRLWALNPELWTLDTQTEISGRVVDLELFPAIRAILDTAH